MKRQSRYPEEHFSNIRTTDPLFALGQSGDQSQRVPRSTPPSTSERSLRVEAYAQEVEGVYIISVAARILEMHPQTLRKYERVGLVTPSRTVGMLRLYSEEDIARLRLIKHLVGDLGLNLAGVHLMLGVFNHLLNMRARFTAVEPRELKRFLADSLDELFELLHAHVRQ